EGGLKLYASGEDLWMAVSYLCGFAAALFELFARAAGARIVTADLCGRAWSTIRTGVALRFASVPFPASRRRSWSWLAEMLQQSSREPSLRARGPHSSDLV